MGWIVGQVAVTHPFATYDYVGTNSVYGSISTPRYLLPIPTSAKEGDVCVVAMVGRTLGRCTDSRMVPVGHGPGGTTAWGWPCGVWVGYTGPKNVPVYDATTGAQTGWKFRDIDIELQSANGGISQFSNANVVCFRGTEVDGIVRVPLKFDPDRLVMGDDVDTNPNAPMPAIPGVGSGALGVMIAYGGIGGSYSRTSAKSPYTGVIEVGDSYSIAYYGRTDERRPPQTPKWADADIGFRHFGIGLR